MVGPAAAGAARAYDHVVVGGGGAGCVVARRLAERGSAVLLLEAGPDDAGREDVADAGSWPAMLGGELDWGVSYAPSPQVAGRRIPLPRGRVLGGSSSTNAMLWYRGHPSDYDGWDLPGWGWADVAPRLELAERVLRVERPRDPHPVATALVDAVVAAGRQGAGGLAELAELTAAAEDDGAGGVRSRRWSTSRAYLRELPPLEQLPGSGSLTVVTGSPALRVEVEGGRATGVVHLLDGQPVTSALVSGGEVVLCAGAVETPRLLLASGVGDPADLARLGVPVVSALAGVGRNLQDHPLLEGVTLRLREPRGPVRDNGGGAVWNWRSASPRSDAPDLHCFVTQAACATPAVAQAHELDRSDPHLVGLGVGLMGSRSRGHLVVRDLAPGGAVDLHPGLLADPADRAALLEGLRDVLDLADGPVFSALGAQRLAPLPTLTSDTGDTDLEELMSLACTTFFHACGTAAMGRQDDGTAVLDPELRVRGVDGLRVADASAFPTVPTSNTLAPVVALAERAADLLVPWSVRR
ncbi:GMC family oxidoreductase [Streptomyces sp. NP160]|uniref:GMC family oxidoreductase n=1 Tax=Streptomyces sp. NP160 TaxID=2586637 RepID=UPI0011199444|nr:GMC family oxidoreductase [Streptomyces sp. NP160]TNM69840.1 GMC family oxidoreductase [Streptomyces sp. NP160]